MIILFVYQIKKYFRIFENLVNTVKDLTLAASFLRNLAHSFHFMRKMHIHKDRMFIVQHNRMILN